MSLQLCGVIRKGLLIKKYLIKDMKEVKEPAMYMSWGD